MRIFVTGGTGFIGAYVTRDLVRAGHEVTVFDLSPDPELVDLLLEGVEGPAPVYVAGDITDAAALNEAMARSGAEKVVHLAALLGFKSDEDPLRSLKVNCEGCLNVFEAALANGVSRVVWASSVGVYGARFRRPEPTGVALANDAPHIPFNLYGATKSLVERFSLHYRKTRGLDVLGLRFAFAYGFGKDRTMARGTGGDFTCELLDRPAAGLAGRVPAGEAVIDFVHIEDAARAVLLALEASGNKAVAVNVTGERTSLREAAALVARLLPSAEFTVEDGSWHGTDHHYDASAALAEIGYAPAIGLEEGFAETIATLRRRAGASAQA